MPCCAIIRVSASGSVGTSLWSVARASAETWGSQSLPIPATVRSVVCLMRSYFFTSG